MKFRQSYRGASNSAFLMKNLIIILASALMALSLSCKTGPKSYSQMQENAGSTIFSSMRTPSGEKLLAAQNGPERSALNVPAINLSTFKLEVTGMVDSSLSLTWDQIKNMTEYQTDTILMYCVEGWEVYGKWEGIKVKDLLDKAHVKVNGKYIVFSTVEGYSTALPIAYLLKYNALLAYNVNGGPLKANDGFPLRLICFGKYGYKWAKWVNKMQVTDQTRSGFWESLGFTDEANVPLARRRFYEGKNAQELVY